MPTTIAEQVSRLAETTAAQPPNEIMGAFTREQADLAASGLPVGRDRGGCPLPDAELLDPHGATTSLYAALGGRLSVLVFYRGAWCPYCNIALNTYQAELVPELAGRGVGLVAISPQTPDGSLSTQEKHELTFTVLSDPGNQVAKVAGILTAPSDEARAAQLQLGLDLTAVNADGTTGLPCPPRSSSTPTTSSVGSTSTPTTAPAPNPARSSPPRRPRLSMTAPFDGRVALITGAGRGIGRAVALQLAEGGARVALVARSVDQLEETAATLRGEGGVALVLPADLADPDAVAEAAATAAKELGPVDILVNNAAVVQPAGPTVSTPPTGWSSAFAVNVQAPIRLTLALLPAMLERGWGRIVNVSSGIVDHPGAMVGLNAYAATKAALEAHTLNLAAEVAGSGVTVNVYRPGSVDTAMQAWFRAQPPAEIGAALHQHFQASYEQGALITPERSARSLLTRLAGEATGEIWNATDA
jgi:NAD(P)-dependent dehydrogenase (short-subunit alcohol dehydrogenase family)/peroxiredoxin